MASVHDVSAQALAKEVATALKEKITQPVWAQFVKTGAHKERPPAERDWWFVRAASVLRTIYKDGPIGVSKLRSRYGGSKNRGVKPEKFHKASGAVLRKVIQQLEKAGLVAYKKDGVHKGRIITSQGLSLLEKSAAKVAKKE